MLKKHTTLIALIFSMLFLVIATLNYPGGSQANENSVGYDWKNNYMSNLFGEKAVNGTDNPARYWAGVGMLFFGISLASFFSKFSRNISQKSASMTIKYFGISSAFFTFLAITPYHDLAVAISVTLSLVSMFYITVFLLKSKLHLLKILSVITILSVYCGTFIYYTGTYIEILPIMQKVSHLLAMLWMLCLEYLTSKHDFEFEKAKISRNN